MKNIAITSLLLIGMNSYGQWTTLQSGTLNELGAVLVDDAQTYWVGGEFGTLLKTTDGGGSWSTQTLAQAGDIEAIVRLNGDTLLFAADDGQIGRSVDNGANWTLIATGAPNVLYDITFNGNDVWASGRDGGLVYSADGGETWTLQNSGSTERLHGIHAIDALNVIVVGRGGTYLRTTDGGDSWTETSLAGGEDLVDVIFLTDAAQTGLIAGPPAEILRSNDLGMNWNTIEYGSALEVGAFASEDPSLVYAIGDNGLILRSLDQGSTWEEMDSEAFSELGGLDVKDGVAVAAGANGTIIKYDPAGGPQAIDVMSTNADLRIYPNPSKGPVNIELSDLEITREGSTLEVRLMDGRLVDRTMWPVGKKKAFIEQLAPGNYVVRLVHADGTSIQRSLVVLGN